MTPYTDTQFTLAVIELLRADGYAVHNGREVVPPGDPLHSKYWFTWRQPPMAECEVGPDCDSPLQAWVSALEHRLANSEIPMDDEVFEDDVWVLERESGNSNGWEPVSTHAHEDEAIEAARQYLRQHDSDITPQRLETSIAVLRSDGMCLYGKRDTMLRLQIQTLGPQARAA